MSAARNAERRSRPSIGLRVLAVPPVPANAVHDCLTRLPARQVVDRVGGLTLWLPRLGITVLPHVPVRGGWVCTLVAVDAGPPGWLPTGVFEVGGTHSLVGYGTARPAAARRLPGLRRYWSRGPVAPTGYRLVEISRHDWRLHARRPRCASPDCPR